MKHITEYTPTELLKMINDVENEHNKLKQEIVDDTIELDQLEADINSKIIKLNELERKYITLIEEYNNR